MADGVTIPPAGTGDTTPRVATDDAGAAGHVQLVKLAVSADGSAALIPADSGDGLYVQTYPRAPSPQAERLTSTNLGAGGNADLTAAAIPSGKTGRLVGADVGASVPLRVDLQTVSGGRTTRATVFSRAGETTSWRTPAPQFVTQAGGAGLSFGASVWNLDPVRAADVYVTLFWEEA